MHVIQTAKLCYHADVAVWRFPAAVGQEPNTTTNNHRDRLTDPVARDEVLGTCTCTRAGLVYRFKVLVLVLVTGVLFLVLVLKDQVLVLVLVTHS